MVAFKGEIIWKGREEKGGRCRVRGRAGKTRSADVPGRWAQSAAVAAALQAMLWRCESGESQRGCAKKSPGSLEGVWEWDWGGRGCVSGSQSNISAVGHKVTWYTPL